MKKSLVLAMAMALGVTASAYAANPFSDVPAGHWAYDSVNKLAAAGVIDGYGDATFGGDKLMTRYEMAQIVAKAMAKGANVDKLAAEFADELDTLGVRVANLEKKADAVKITGEVRYHYADHDTKIKGKDGNENKLRSRIWFNGAINDDWTYTGMIQNEQNFDNDDGDEDTDFQRAYINGKLGGVKVQGGRYNLKVAEGNVYDNRFDGIQAAYGKDVKLTVGYGEADPGNHKGSKADEVWYAELGGKISSLSLGAGYYDFKDIGRGENLTAAASGKDQEIWQVNATYAFDKNFKLGAMYLNGDKDGYTGSDDDGYVVTASYKGAKASQPGSWGIVAKYYDQGGASYVDHTMNGLADSMTGKGFEGYSIFANYAFAKNIVGQVEWYDLDGKDDSEDAETLWAQLLFTF
ncbi:MAG: S-layer homology domain-containing protein [Phascolarctobacterium sp.]|uniref:S-layer homology domain-containing protein n=1 Tax=Phascolarctobacterium sp. TaxID=2049039 RepID=UPI0026DB1A73|nr:S-layer homology domain-containing protein [Phascolarctobacterium sp.]MDO4920303.1 S-layer homology domain-containing protein [Phascolarctobacterium sp.]